MFNQIENFKGEFKMEIMNTSVFIENTVNALNGIWNRGLDVFRMNPPKQPDRSLEDCQIPGTRPFVDFSNITKAQFDCFFAGKYSKIRLLSPRQIVTVLDKLSCDTLKNYVSDQQFKQLDFSKFSIEQVNCLVESNPGNRVGALSPKQLETVLEKLSCSNKKYVSDEHFQRLDFTKVKQTQFDCLVQKNPRKRIGGLSPKQLETVLEKLSCRYIQYFVTDDQFKGLDFTKVKRHQYYCLPQKVEMHSPEQVDILLDKLDSFILQNLVTHDQFKGLNFTKVNKEQLDCLLKKEKWKRIKMLSSQQLDLVLDKLSCSDIQYYVDDNQFKGLDFKNINKDQLNCLVENDPAKRIGVLSPKQLGTMLDKLTCESQKYVTNEQFEGLDFSKVTKTQLNCLLENNPKRIDLIK